MTVKRLRCAIYTRKSSEEGLDQSFNSLDAQREACAAFILSQTGEGWSALKETYEDGGYSGGSMDRPGLKQLLIDIEERRIDVIVVYKVDRLTRSLTDFARMVDILDRAGASFVSVTQAFNTTTSMGRLTLNVLLSFAQYEREITGERIRDKIRASKAKGMWMGGNPPLGYDVRERRLEINPSEAQTVRAIYQRYLDAPNVFALRDGLARDGICSKQWTSRAGRNIGGSAFTHGALYHILANKIYVGEIVHRGQSHPGEHAAIVSRELFDAAQARLKDRAPALSRKRARGRTAPLLGKLFDDHGHAMTSAHGQKRGVRYFYYVSCALNAGARADAGSLPRVSAPRLEAEIVALVAPLLGRDWQSDDSDVQRTFDAVDRVVLSADAVSLDLCLAGIEPDAANRARSVMEFEHIETGWRIRAPIALKRMPNERRLYASGAARSTIRTDRALIRAVVMARRWDAILASGEVRSIEALAAREDLSAVHLGKLIPLAFLAPDVVAAILAGRQPARLNLSALISEPLPLAWDDQRAWVARFA